MMSFPTISVRRLLYACAERRLREKYIDENHARAVSYILSGEVGDTLFNRFALWTYNL
jgi:hypothetical protein